MKMYENVKVRSSYANLAGIVGIITNLIICNKVICWFIS